MKEDPAIVRRSIRIYRMLLRLYPSAHRHRFGPEMAQVFRDGCRTAHHAAGWRGVASLWLRLVPDLCLTAAGEHLAVLKGTRIMKQKPMLIRTSNWMLGAAIVAGLVSGALAQTPWAIVLCAVLTGLLMVAHALTALRRPPADWWRMWLVALFVFIYYGLLAPMWAKLLQDTGAGSQAWMPPLIFIPLFTCLAVALFKSAQFWWNRARPSRA